MVGNPSHVGMGASAYSMDLSSKIRVVPDFPKSGVSFKDITTLLKDGAALRYTIDCIAEHYKDSKVDVILGVESRGFLFGAPLAYKMGTGFILVRKPGKLPSSILRASYELEYGSDSLEIHKDAIEPGQRVLLVDDLLATGGTMAAAADLVRQLKGEIAGFAFVVELTYLNGREKLGDAEILSLVQYDS
jgi:adenine phosphoribosyltransferase